MILEQGSVGVAGFLYGTLTEPGRTALGSARAAGRIGLDRHRARGRRRRPTSYESFTDGDFHALSPACARDPQYDDRRLVLRRKLLAIGKGAVERAKEQGLALEARGSLHSPHAFNRMKVERMWTYACRDKKAKARLKRTLGADLAKDLDAAYRNAYLCAAVESDAIEVSLRVHADAWYDATNLANRLKAEGVAGWIALLNALEGFRLRLADWKGEWPCGALSRDRIDEFLKFWKPGEHALSVERRFPAPPGARGLALDPEMPERIVALLAGLVPMYRFVAWSEESDFLFRK